MQEPRKSALVILGIFLLLFYFLTSGLLFEITKRQGSGGLDVPYSIGLSNSRVNFSGSYTSSDIRALSWLSEQDLLLVWSDYNGAILTHSTKMYGKAPYHAWPEPPKVYEYYLFITSWSGKNDKFVFGRIPGVRWLTDLPDTTNMELVYIDGYTKIYKSIIVLED